MKTPFDSLRLWFGLFAEERQVSGGGDTVQGTMKAELSTLHRGVDEIARRVIAGLEAVIEGELPFLALL